MKRTTGKRTHTLKSILERQEKTTRESTLELNVDSDENLATSLPNLLEIKEDLPTVNRDEVGNLKTVHFNYGKLPPPTGAPSNLSKSILIFNELINKEVASAAKLL
jgi:hypothetical protein